MSGRVGLWLVLFSLIVSECATTVAEDHHPAAVDVVSLSIGEPTNISNFGAPPPFLARELVRQAFLIAARDECGLRTCDATLREEIPNDPSLRVVSFDLFSTLQRPIKDMDVCYTLSRKNGTNVEKLGEWKFRTDVFSPKMITDLTDLAERMSRGKFTNLLHEQKLGKPLPPPREFAGVPRETQERLWEWNEITVLGALRRIHGEIRAKGESPELLAGLAIGYANLGSLTEYYFSPAHKAFSARALLYAERLLRETDGSDWALWHRAYVRALVGLHEQARTDVKAAKKLWDKKASKRLPFWTDILAAFCEGQLPQMLEKAKTRNEQQLARYLNFEATFYSAVNAVTIKESQAVLDRCPDCLRVADAVCSTNSIGPMREITEYAFPRFSKTLRSRLPDVCGFPAALDKRLSETKLPEEMQEKELEDEVEFRDQLVADLKAEAVSGRDTFEPSLAVLGQMVEEIQFVQVMRRVQLEGYVWGVPTEHTVATYRPLCAHHRYASFLDSYARDKSVSDKAAQSLVSTVDPRELGLGDWWFVNWLRFSHSEVGTLWLRITWQHADPVWSDEMLGIGQGIAGPPDERKYNKPHMDSMWQTSCKLPASLAIQVDRNWNKAKFFSATVEKDNAQDPILMASLANRYLKTKQWDDAERCAKQKIRVAPDYAAYETLAEIYKQKRDMARWKETLERSLDLPSMSLEQATIRNQIAQYHMGRKEWKEAVVYADAAAESYSEWSMMTAARCHEMLGEWAKSEALMRAISERYDNSAMGWMLWCHRTGHGDAAAADTCARNHFESLGESFYWTDRQKIGIYYLLRNEPEKAFLVFQQTFGQTHGVYDAMHAAMLADALGKDADRDSLLSKIVAGNPAEIKQEPRAGLYKQVVEFLRKALPPGSVEDLDFKKLDTLILVPPDLEVPANLEYFVAMFLKNRGAADKSHEYLIRCAQSLFDNKYNYVLARKTLRDLKIPIPESPTTTRAAVKK